MNVLVAALLWIWHATVQLVNHALVQRRFVCNRVDYDEKVKEVVNYFVLKCSYVSSCLFWSVCEL